MRRLSRIEADQHDLEVATGVERRHPHRARDGVQHLRAEHGAIVINERQDHGAFLIEEATEQDIFAVFVFACEVQRYLFAEMLVNADLGQYRRASVRLDIAGRRNVAAQLRE